MADRPDIRLGAIKAADVILAALQAAFAQENLFNGGNIFRFVRDDPRNSRVWVCDPESRLQERDGNRSMIMVSRGEYAPQEMHLYNMAGSNFHDKRDYSDLATTPIFITCEAGTKTTSEVLASIVYNVLKIFRKDLMAEFDIFDIRLRGISPAQKHQDVPGEPWITTVTLTLQTQEQNHLTELANHLNHTVIAAALSQELKRKIVALDSPIS